MPFMSLLELKRGNVGGTHQYTTIALKINLVHVIDPYGVVT